jgi:uncharacterized protein
MEYRKLGSTNLMVSRLCFGSLTIGPLQANLPIEQGATILKEAFDRGINFIDTAKLYKTYPYIKRAIELTHNKDIIISSKSYDYTYEGMKESVAEALEELGVKKISIFSLHEQESKLTLKGHREALDYLIEAKKQGIIEAIGVSTHAIEVVNAAAEMECIDVIHPLMNKAGLGILDGTIDEMLEAIKKADKNGKGIYAMKVLGGGNLLKDSASCFEFALSNPTVDSIAVGMQSLDEIRANIDIFNGIKPDDEIVQRLSQRVKKLHIDFWCEGCGKCVEVCQNKAIEIIDNKASVDHNKCILCGYCSAACPAFCIKVV